MPDDHPLRSIRAMVDAALKGLSRSFGQMYPDWGRPSIAPEKLLRALLLQPLYSIRSERLLMEQLEIQPIVPLVRGAEHRRTGVGANGIHSARIATGSLEGDIAARSSSPRCSIRRARTICCRMSISSVDGNADRSLGQPRKVFSVRTRDHGSAAGGPGQPDR